MSLVMFASQGIYYDSKTGGAVKAIFVPSKEQEKIFPDLEGTSASQIADRYGAAGKKPLWKIVKGQVVVYGVLPTDLSERREEIKIWLPQQFLPASSTVFYFVMGEKWIIHGTKRINDDGQIEWAISKLAIKDDGATKLLIDAISERMLDGEEDKYCIAVTGNDPVLEELKEELKPFDLEVVRFESLKPARGENALYKHRNHSLIMMTIAIFAMLVVVATGGYWMSNNLSLGKAKQKIKQVQLDISQIKLNKKIGYIKRPQDVLAAMDKSLQQSPSSIMNAVAYTGSAFGEIREVSFDPDERAKKQSSSQKGKDKVVTLGVEIEKIANKYLVDQENLARTFIVDKPWIRDIKSYKRPGRNHTGMRLEVTVRIE